MKFKVDENLPSESAELFRRAGHQATTVFDEALAGAGDGLLAERIRQEERCLLTLDTDFADIRAYPPNDYYGIIVIRSRIQDKLTLLNLVRDIIARLASQPLRGCLWVVEPDVIRIREGTSN